MCQQSCQLKMESVFHESESPVTLTCENLNNSHVYGFLCQLGPVKTADELISFERCPEGLTRYAFKNTLRSLKTRYNKLQKNRYSAISTRNFFGHSRPNRTSTPCQFQSLLANPTSRSVTYGILVMPILTPRWRWRLVQNYTKRKRRSATPNKSQSAKSTV